MIRNANVRGLLLFLMTEDRPARHPMAAFPLISRAGGRKGSKPQIRGIWRPKSALGADMDELIWTMVGQVKAWQA
jgi:hypothetical protein